MIGFLYLELVNFGTQLKLNEDEHSLGEWLKVNKLKLNVSKTKLMIIGKDSNISTSLNITIDGTEVEKVNSFKYLGVIVDDQLKFNEHIDYLCKKISKKLGFLRRCSNFLTHWSKLTVFNTIVLPHFSYASTVLYLANKTEIERLQVLQNRAMRIILKCSIYTSIDAMLKELNWFKISDLVEIHCMRFLHKIRLNLAPLYCSNKLMKFENVHGHDTRFKHNFILEHKNQKQAQNSVFFKAVVVNNALPENIKESNSISQFMSSIKQYYRQR